jgi:hypothetical protein
MNEKDRIIEGLKKEKKFSEEIQKKIGRDRGIIYSVGILEKIEVPATFQRICVVSQKIFPESFSLTEFPEYLDSRTVRNCLWHCTHKQWLIGSDKTKYNLTDKGKEEISIVFGKIKNNQDIDNLPLKLRMSKKSLKTKPEDDEVNYLKEIEKTKAYSKFIENNIGEISSFEIKKSLGGDRYSPLAYFHNKIKSLKEMAKRNKEKKIEEYLNWIKKENILK